MKHITGVISAAIILCFISSDADARRHKRPRHKHPTVERSILPARSASVFDTQDWQPAVVLPGFMSVAQAAMAGSYTWQPENIFPPVRVEWVKASEFNAFDQELMSRQKPIITRMPSMFWGLMGAIMAMLTGITGLAWYTNKDLARLT